MIKCDYCGRENPDETATCPGCGTPSPQCADEAPSEASRPISVSGMVDCAVGAAGIASGHIGGVIHLARGLGLLAEENSAQRLLERAAALESVDVRWAIALYKLLALNHPGTREAEEAIRNVQTLEAARPELKELG